MEKLLAVAVVLAAGFAQAKTVLWYRFDACGTNATRATASTVITNVAAPGTLDGKAHSYSETTLGTDSNLMPYGVASVPEALKLRDPVSNLYYDDVEGMHFGAAAISGASGAGSAVVCPWDEKLALSNLTVEAIFRLPANVSQWAMAPIVIMNNEAYQATWSLQIYNGKLFFRGTSVKSDGTQVSTSFTGTQGIDDGKWHHVAMTFDPTTKMRSLYLDYVLVNAYASQDAVGFHYPGKPLVIGANTQVGNRTFPGDIDEVRISDVALAPAQMLRTALVTDSDPDVLLYLPFEKSSAEYAGLFGWNEPLLDCSSNKAYAVTLNVTADPPRQLAIGPDALSVPAETIYDGLRGEGRASSGAYLCLTNAAVNYAGRGASFNVSDPTLTMSRTSFTLETFVRCEKQMQWVDQSKDSHVVFNSSAFKVLIHCAHGKPFLRTFDEEGASKDFTLEAPRLDDGNWHHLAVVYDAEAKVCSLVSDYTYVVTNNVTLRHDIGSGGDLRIGGSTTTYQLLSGWLDEIRLTRRALQPHEFQTTHRLADEVLAWYDFEDSLKVKPLGEPWQRSGTLFNTDSGRTAWVSALAYGKGFVDGTGAPVREGNAHSLRIDRGRAVYPRYSALETPSATVEMFLKGESLEGDNNGAWAGVVGLFRNACTDYAKSGSIACHDTFWSLRYGEGANKSNPLHFWFQTAAYDNGHDVYFPSGVTYLDGQWHHVAFSYAPAEGGAKTSVKLYWDYQPVREVTVDAAMTMPTTDSTLAFGMSTVSGRLFTGYVDELRIHEGVVGPEKFLHKSRHGLCILIR